MDNPGLSLFNNGVSLQVDAINQQEKEEEEDELEEQRRLEAELARKLDGAFDDLDLDDGDGDDSSLYYPPHHQLQQQHDALTPGQVPLKYVTSTPYTEHTNTEFKSYAGKGFHQLAVDETTCEDQDEFDNPRQGHPQQQRVEAQAQAAQQLHQVGEDAASWFPDRLNKSDSEKARERGYAADQQNPDTADLMVLYTARGREIERLQSELQKSKEESTAQLRQLRQHLATTSLEKQQQEGSCGQLEQLLADTRRENKLLREEIYQLKEKVVTLDREKESLQLEHEGDKEVVTQLQSKLQQLQTTDTVLRARQQHDAVVRSLKERYDEEVKSLRVSLDAASSKQKLKDKEYNDLRDKYDELQNNHDYTVKEKTSQIEELSSKLAESQKKTLELAARDQSAEVDRLNSSLRASRETVEELESQLKRSQTKVIHLQSEIAGYEAISEEGHTDSMVALGLTANSRDEGGSLRLKDELHRSLNGNKSKREEIARLETLVAEKESRLKLLQTEKESLRSSLTAAEVKLTAVERKLTESVCNADELAQLRKEVGQLRKGKEELQRNLEEAEKQNIQVKKCMTEMLEGNNEDKMEAIDSLREEYEEHCRAAVEQTKALMEGEVRRLKIELDVYNQTVMELKKKLEAATKQVDAPTEDTKALLAQVADLELDLGSARRENDQLKKEIEKMKDDSEKDKGASNALIDEMKVRADIEEMVKKRLEEDFALRLEKSREELRKLWELNHKGDIEEAVSAARLQWLKRLPEMEREGGAARESIGQLEILKRKITEVSKESEKLKNELITEKLKREEKEKEADKIRKEIGTLKKVQADESVRLQEELRAALSKQQEQWQNILTNNREESELQRKQIINRFEEEVQRLEKTVNKKEEEKVEVENKLDQIETEYGLALEKWRRVLEEKNRTIEKLRGSGQDTELLKSELTRRMAEADEQKREMARMAEMWENQVNNIRDTHTKERKELDEVTEKYRSLKAKVRKYQRHVETKENHYKQEYNRLENEFKSTLERLRERMEQAYSNKEREVEQELGNMRQQFTQELRKIAERKSDHATEHVTDHVIEKNLMNLEDESLKRYYVKTSEEIKQLLK